MACKYDGGAFVPSKLRDFTRGGRWYHEDPPLKPMSGPTFEAWRAAWERQRRVAEAWRATIGSTSGGGAPLAGEEEEEDEDQDPAFLKAIEESLKDADERKRAEEEDRAAAIAAVKEAEAREAAAEADGYIIDLSD